MNKNWITGLTVASVVGTGGAAFAGMHATSLDAVQAAAEMPTTTVASTVTTPTSKSFVAAEAGLVQVSLADGILTVDSTSPNTGWMVASFTPPASHVEVVFSTPDGARSITFVADVVNGEIEGAVVDTTPATTTTPTTAAPVTPATPAPEPTVLVPSTQRPASSHTSAASGSGDDEDEHESDDHEEHEEGDDD